MSSRALTPAQLSSKRRRASNFGWAITPDRVARTAPGRKAAADRFEQFIIDELGYRPPADELAKRVRNLRSAYFSELGQKSAAARRARARGTAK